MPTPSNWCALRWTLLLTCRCNPGRFHIYLKRLQEDVFEDTKHLVRSALDGYNVCVFAYGQTGSGKTFTIYGNEACPGLTPRGVREMFAQIDKDAGKASYSVRVQMLELYQVRLTPDALCVT